MLGQQCHVLFSITDHDQVYLTPIEYYATDPYKLGECMALWGKPNEPSSYTASCLHLYIHIYAMCR